MRVTLEVNMIMRSYQYNVILMAKCCLWCPFHSHTNKDFTHDIFTRWCILWNSQCGCATHIHIVNQVTGISDWLMTKTQRHCTFALIWQYIKLPLIKHGTRWKRYYELAFFVVLLSKQPVRYRRTCITYAPTGLVSNIW